MGTLLTGQRACKHPKHPSGSVGTDDTLGNEQNKDGEEGMRARPT